MQFYLFTGVRDVLGVLATGAWHTTYNFIRVASILANKINDPKAIT